jgi:hypothetical protein
MLGDGMGHLGAAKHFATAQGGVALASGDFNEDGHTDLAVVSTSDTISILLGDGAGAFGPAKNITVASRPFSVAVGDFNNDGSADLVVANQTSNNIAILLGDGAGNFSPPMNFTAGMLTNSVAVADFNADGKSDVAASNINGTTGILGSSSLFLGDGIGGMSSASNIEMGRGSDNLAVGDFNKDGRPDLAIVNRSSRTTSILTNTCAAPPKPEPALSINDVLIAEGDSGTKQANFTVSLSAASDRPVSVGFYTIEGTAKSGSDYQSVFGHLTFAPGITSQVISVPILGDTNIEPDETFLVQLRDALNAKIVAGQAQGTIKNDDTSPQAQFSSASYTVEEGAGNVAVVVNRVNTSAAASVDYATSDTAGLTACSQATGTASSRCDYANTVGTLRFAAGESSKTIFIPVVDDGYVEGSESFTIRLSNPVGMNLGTNSSATITITDNDSTTSNPIVGAPFFVRQQYIDFLGREPDPGGFAAWQNILNNCPPSGKDANGNYCDRIEVSAGFFRSPEFQDRGSFIFRFYAASLGRNPFYSEFMPDLAKVSGFLSDAQLEANKVAFVNEFMTRTEFVNKYGSLSNTAFVDTLIQTAGMTSHPLRGAWIDVLNNGTATRAQVLRAFTESLEVYNKFYNQVFVVMQYFGYLRRDPDASYLTWIQIMNSNGGDYRGMISGFMNSNEYVLRFGP